MSARTAAQRHLLRQVPLSEYFETEEELHTVLSGVQVRAVAVLLRAEHPLRRHHCTGQDHYVLGVGHRPTDLGSYIFQQMSFKGVFNSTILPLEVRREMSRRDIQYVLDRVAAELLMMVINGLVETHNLYYMEGSGEWCFTHVVREEYDRLRNQAKSVFINDGTYHGVASKQGRRRSRQLRAAFTGARG